MSSPIIKVDIKYRDLEVSFEGEVNEVYRQVIKWFNKILPAIDIAEKLILDIDFERLASKLGKYIYISRDGEVVLKPSSDKLSLHNKLLLILAMFKLLEFIGKRSSSATLSELSHLLNTSAKTISSRLSELKSMGYIERIRENKNVKYKISLRGLLYIEDKI